MFGEDIDPFLGLKTLFLVVNIAAMLLCCHMILSLLVRRRVNANYASTRGQKDNDIDANGQSKSSQLNCVPWYYPFTSLIIYCKKVICGLLHFITHSLPRLGFGHLNTQKWLRLGATLSALIANIARIYTSFYSWYLDISVGPKIGSLFYNVFFWLTVAFYATALLDRFERVEMIVPKTWSHKLVRAAKLLFIFMGLAIVVLETFSKIKWILQEHDNVHTEKLNLAVQILSVFVGFGSMLLELSLNLRLIHTSLKHHVEVGNEPRDHSRRYKRLRNKMIALYTLLLVFDAFTLFSFAISILFQKFSDTISLLANACAILHLFVSFKLLDIFLKELKQAKVAKTTALTSTQKNHIADDVYTVESIPTGLVPMDNAFSSPASRANFNSFFTSYSTGESNYTPAEYSVSKYGGKM